jgi:drug/metabolite transporter (DMT)-like permease
VRDFTLSISMKLLSVHWRSTQTVGLTLAVVGAVLFSAKAIVVKLSYYYAVDATTLLALRMLLSLPFFLVAALWASRRQQNTRLTLADWGRVGFLGFSGYYLASFLDFAGLQYITASLERLILFLYPTLVLVISVWLLKKRLMRHHLIALGLSYLGVVVVLVNDWQGAGSEVLLGASLVFGSAISYSLYLVASGEMVGKLGTVRLTAYATCIAALLCLLQFILTHDWHLLRQLPLTVWKLSLFNAVFCTVIPVFATMAAIARVGATVVSLTALVGPVATIFLAAFFLGEPITLLQLAGTCLVMAGIFVISQAKHNAE